MAENETIYLDNAATTRVAPEVADVVLACMREAFGNPSSAHAAGIAAERRVKVARSQLLAALGDPHGDRGDVVWTSGGTESDALGVLGAARSRRGGRVIYGATEHPAVRESAARAGDGGCEVVAARVTATGVVDVDALDAQLTADTAVVAVMLVNNEIGTINPVAEIAARVRARAPDAHVHCDAVQALGKLPVDVAALGVDSLAVAAHKLHGPKGAGALWLRKGARITPLWGGGGQQGGLRSGTLNVPGIAGLGAAAELAARGLAERSARWTGYAERLVAAARGTGREVRINGDGAPRAAHVLSLAFRGLPAEPMLHVLESRGVLVSAGSACAERDRKPSPVLMAIGLPRDFATLRLSFGRDTTDDDIDTACRVLAEAVASF